MKSQTRIYQAQLNIKGDVIGVGFRQWVKSQAKSHNVTGWAKNIYESPEVFGADGGVMALIQGEKEKVEEIIEVIKKGSSLSRIDEVDINYSQPDEIFISFEIKK